MLKIAWSLSILVKILMTHVCEVYAVVKWMVVILVNL